MEARLYLLLNPNRETAFKNGLRSSRQQFRKAKTRHLSRADGATADLLTPGIFPDFTVIKSRR